MKAMIAMLPGDGIGPEVVAEAVFSLEAVAERFGHTFDFQRALIGGEAMDRTGLPFPAETRDICLAADAVLLGAVGGPQWEDPRAPVRPEQGLLALRETMETFANLRPVRVLPAFVERSVLKPERVEGVDFVIVRELTGGIYFGDRVEATEATPVAADTMRYSAQEVRRVARVAFDLARHRRGHVTSVDKANVLACSRLWRSVVDEMAAVAADVEVRSMLVDAAAMHLLRRPADFDVLLTANMFGDILADEASMLTGSIGMLPSASLGLGRRGIYEPIHGSAPDIAGSGSANPLAAILSAAMLLRHSLGLETEAVAIEDAVSSVLDAGFRTPDMADPGTRVIGSREMGARVAEQIGMGKGR